MGLRDKLKRAKGKVAREEVTELLRVPCELDEGERVYIREMDGAESSDYKQSQYKVRFDPRGRQSTELNLKNIQARLVTKCLCGEDNVRVFTDKEEDEVGAFPSTLLGKLYELARKVNAMEDRPEEDSLKNAPTGGSSTDSPGTSDGAASNGAYATSPPAN